MKPAPQTFIVRPESAGTINVFTIMMIQSTNASPNCPNVLHVGLVTCAPLRNAGMDDACMRTKRQS